MDCIRDYGKRTVETVLHINASPRGDKSFSAQAGGRFLERYLELNPDCSLDVLELESTVLPEFDSRAVSCVEKLRAGEELSGELAGYWSAVEAVIDRFKAPSYLVLSCPMWNFSVPYRLKHYLDLIVQAGYTFAYRDGRQVGLVQGKPARLFLARGGEYGPGSGSEHRDFQRKYLEEILGFIGFSDIRTYLVEPTGSKGPQAASQALERVVREALLDMGDF